jgi:hypothetical protein
VLAWAGPDAARLAEAPDLAVLVVDRREGKEHREFEEAWTSCSFGIAIGSGCMDLSCIKAGILRDFHFE